MSDRIIKVENLGKKYVLRHQQHENYTALRDVVTQKLKHYALNVLNPFRPSSAHSSREEFWALKKIDLEIKRGEVVGVIGRNGAGKTTLLKLLSRITEPSTGKMRIRGRTASLLEVGTGFHPELTGRENIFLSGAILGMTRREIKHKFDEIVQFAEVEKFLDTPVKRYSSGMYVRLAFAVAAHLEPEILLIDEVLAVGDIAFQKKCLRKMDDVGKQGRTVIFVSHNMIAVKRLCSLGIVLDKGQVHYKGPIEAAVEKYVGLDDHYEFPGYVKWDDPKKAPGNHLATLMSISLLVDNEVTNTLPVNKDIEVQIEYANIKPGENRLVGIHVLNSMDLLLFASTNWKLGSSSLDKWAYQKYPAGIFRTSCIIPKFLLNPGKHIFRIFLFKGDNWGEPIWQYDVSAEISETHEFRREYSGEWVGLMRPSLDWATKQIE